MALTAAERKRRHRERMRLRLAAPGLTARAADPSIPDDALTPLEQAIRSFRVRVLDDLGGAAGLPLTRLLQVEALSERWLVKGMLTTEVLDLGQSGRLIDRRTVRARPLLADWLRALDGYERALRDVGLDPIEQVDSAEDLESIVREIIEARPPGSTDATSPPSRDSVAPGPGDNAEGAKAPRGRERGPARPAVAEVSEPQAEPVEVRPASLVPTDRIAGIPATSTMPSRPPATQPTGS